MPSSLIDRRTLIAGTLAAGLLPAGSLLAQTGQLTAREVFRQIKAATGQPWDPNPTDDRIIFGDRNVPVTGIATCFLATIEVLRKAKAAGLNYIVPHEASFYERYDDFAESAVADDDPVLTAKQRFLTENGMVIQRLHSHAHSRPGDAIMIGLIARLGWTGQRIEDLVGMPQVRLAPAPARDVALHVKAALGRRTLRVSGDLDRTISTVSISAGMPGENAHIRQLESGADAVLMGEVREPEVLGYAQDMADSRGITVFLSGHTNEDAGMGVIADWLKTVFPALPVQWLPIVDPYTNPA